MKRYNDKTGKQPSLKTAQEYYERGRKNFHAGEFENAAVDFTEAILRNKQFMEAWFCRGNSYFKLGKFDLALESYMGALSLVSANRQLMPGEGAYRKSKIFSRIAAAQLAQDEYQKTISYSGESSRLMEEYTMVKDFAEPWYIEGMAWLKLGRDDRALYCFSSAIAKCTRDDYYINSLLERSRLRQKLWKFEGALADCDTILQQNPDHVEALIERACSRSAEAFQWSDEDLEDLRRAVELCPDNPKAWDLLANCLFGIKRVEEAGDIAAKALELNIENEKRAKRLRSIMDAARIKKALQEENLTNYHMFVNSYPCAKVFSQKKDVDIKEEELDKTILETGRVLLVNPNDVTARVKRVSAWIGKGELEKAVDDIDKLIDFNPDNAEFLEMMKLIDFFKP